MRVRKTFRISEEANVKLSELFSKSNARSESDFIDSLILQSAEGTSFSSNDTSDLTEILNLIQTIAKDTNKKSYVIMDVLNSLVTNGISVEDTDFRNHKSDPHSWISQAEKSLSDNIYSQMRKKSAGDGHK